MKKLIVLILLSLTTSFCFSQSDTKTDSTKIPDYQLKRGIKDIMIGDVMKKERDTLLSENSDLRKLSFDQRELIKKYVKDGELYRSIIKSHVDGEVNIREQIQNNFNLYLNERKEKRKFRVLTITLGITSAALLAKTILN